MSDLLDNVRDRVAATSADLAMVERQRSRLMQHIGQARPGPTNATPESIDWEIPDTAVASQSNRTFAIAAVSVLVLLVVASLFVIGASESAEVATEPVDEVGQDHDRGVVAMPPGPVFGFDRPVVLLDGPFEDGARCLDPHVRTRQVRSTFGTSAVAVSQVFEPTSGDLGSSVFIDLGGLSFFCTEDGSFGSAISSPAIHGSASDFPAVVVDWFGGSSESNDSGRWLVEIGGFVDESVSEIVITSPQLSEQSYLVGDGRFRLDALFADEVPAEEVLIEVRFTDGSSAVQTALDLDGSRACDPQSMCIDDWYAHTISEATIAGASSQVDALSDYELTQDEYDQAASQFVECLPPTLSSVVVADSNQAATVTGCYQEHLVFIDQARVLANQRWISDPDNFDELLGAQFQSDWPELRTAPTPLGLLSSPLEAFFRVIVDPHALSEGYEMAQQARMDHTNECLAGAGFADWNEGPVATPSPVEFIDSTNLEDHLAEFGYGVAGQAFANIAQVEWRESDWQSEILEAQRERVFGGFDEVERQDLAASLSVCSAEAADIYPLPNEHLSGSTEIWGLLSDVRREVESDPLVVDAQQRWSDCVQRAEYQFSSRGEAIAHLRTLVPSNPVDVDLGEDWETGLQVFREAAELAREQEAQLVAVDLNCAISTGLEELRREVRFAIESQMIAVDGARLEELLS